MTHAYTLPNLVVSNPGCTLALPEGTLKLLMVGTPLWVF